MSKLKEIYLKKYAYYGSINCEAKKETHRLLNETYENLGLAYITRNIFHEERKIALKLIALVGVLLATLLVFQISIPTFLVFGVSTFVAKKVTRNIDLRDQFKKLYPNKLNLFHKSNKEINQSISKLEMNINTYEKVIKNLENNGKMILYRHQLLYNSSDDMIDKIEDLKDSSQCNRVISIEKLKEYRKLLVQFEKERKMVHSYFSSLNDSSIPSATQLDEENKTNVR